jgi:prepilin-type N-terminal cleavage/methylation domain-containing protein
MKRLSSCPVSKEPLPDGRGSVRSHGAGSVPRCINRAATVRERSRGRSASQAGVTLIEMLIAVTLVGLLSVGMVFAMRIGLMIFSKTETKLMDDRKVVGAQRILEQELEGLVPFTVGCTGRDDGEAPQVAGAVAGITPYFQGGSQTMRMISTFSLQQAWRGQPQLLDLVVIPGETTGVRLVVNELPFSPASAGSNCTGMMTDPETGLQAPKFIPLVFGPRPFVLADQLAFCRFSYLIRGTFQKPTPVWSARAGSGWPLAIRVEMAPLVPDGSRLQPFTIVAPIHLHRAPEITYVDINR